MDVPVAHLRKIKNTEGVSSITRESEHFSSKVWFSFEESLYNAVGVRKILNCTTYGKICRHNNTTWS